MQTVGADAAREPSRHRISLSGRLENILDVFDKEVSYALVNTPRPNSEVSETTLQYRWEDLRQLDEVLFSFRQWVSDISTRTGTGTQKGIRKVSCYDVLQTLEDAQGVTLVSSFTTAWRLSCATLSIKGSEIRILHYDGAI
jgi:hypothetical protein